MPNVRHAYWSNQSFSAKDASEKPKSLGEIVSSDLGFVPVKTDAGEQCFFTYTDHASDMTVVCLMVKKSEQVQRFIHYVQLMETISVKRLKCNNCGEYINKDMAAFCREKGILLTPSSAHTPEQNGLAERKNRTLVEMAKAMLLDAALPKTCWGMRLCMLLTFAIDRPRVPTGENALRLKLSRGNVQTWHIFSHLDLSVSSIFMSLVVRN